MNRIFALLVIGALLFGCTQYGGAATPGGTSTPAGTPAMTPDTSVAPSGPAAGAPTAAPGTSLPASVSNPVTVHIKNLAFEQPDITVKQGTTVTWVNDDAVSHTVTFDRGFGSQPLSSGQSYSHTFREAAGDYTYHCIIHPSMQGVVRVA